MTYLHHDAIGSTRVLTEARGAVSATFSYAPYGALTGAAMYVSDFDARILNDATGGLSNWIAGVDGSCAGPGYRAAGDVSPLPPAATVSGNTDMAP